MTVMQRVVKPKNPRAKRALVKREPKIIENTKQCLFLHGIKTGEFMRKCIKDIYALKRQDSKLLQSQDQLLPFEDILPVERLAHEHDASLFAYATHSKKRPNNLILGRMFNHHILDLIELGVDNYLGLEDFKNKKITVGNKPCMVFCGTQFEDLVDYKNLKNILIDFFRGVEATDVRLQGFEHALLFTATDDTIYMRSYKILLKKSGTRIPRVELEEIGPCMDLKIRRTKFASDDLKKKACRQPKHLKIGKKKNQSRDVFGTKLGRIHMTKQDLGQLQTRKMKALKKSSAKAKATNNEASTSTAEPMEVSQE